MAQAMMAQFVIQLVVVAVLILVVIMVVIRIGRLGGNAASAAKRMADPVPGTLLVTAISMPGRRNAVFQMTRLTGVVAAEGVDAFAIQHNGLVRTARWPQPGTTLPVIVDRADPRNFAIEWDKIRSGADAALGNAQAIAAAMRAKQGDSP